MKKGFAPILILVAIFIVGVTGFVLGSGFKTEKVSEISKDVATPKSALSSPPPELSVYRETDNNIVIGQLSFELPNGYKHFYCKDQSEWDRVELSPKVVIDINQPNDCHSTENSFSIFVSPLEDYSADAFTQQCVSIDLVRSSERKEIDYDDDGYADGYVFEYIQEPADAPEIVNEDLSRVVCLHHDNLSYKFIGPYNNETIFDQILSTFEFTD